MFDLNTARKFRNLVPELNELLAKHGFAMELGNRISVGTVALNGTFTVKPVAGKGEKDPVAAARDAAKATFEANAETYGLKKEDFNQIVNLGRGRMYRIVGLNLGRSKNVVKIVNTRTNKEYLTSVADINLRLRSVLPPQKELSMDEMLREEMRNERRAMRRMAGNL